MLGADLAKIFYELYCASGREMAELTFKMPSKEDSEDDHNLYREITSATLTELIRDGSRRRYYVRS